MRWRLLGGVSEREGDVGRLCLKRKGLAVGSVGGGEVAGEAMVEDLLSGE